MLNSRPVRLLWHSLNWLTRLTILASTASAVLCAIIIVVLRYWLLPDIEEFHGRITSSMSAAMGNPVNISKIEGDWNGLHPHLKLTDVNVLDMTGEPAITLPSIDASVSWLSILAGELRLASLEIDSPKLLIRRDTAGKLYMGNIALASSGTDNDLANWLLHQSRMIVRNASIVWQDDQRKAPILELNQVNLRIENLFSHHQFALRAMPPAALSTPLDLRGDFHGKRIDDLTKWRGQIYTQLDYTDLLSWRPWIDLPAQLSRGRGALRTWLSVKDGQFDQLTTDLVLRDVATRLAADVPEMDVHYLSGRAAWNRLENGWEFSTRHLTMRLHNGVHLEPTDFYFKTTTASRTHPADGELRANLLQLESLVSLANFLPLDAGLREKLNSYAPRGHVSDLDMSWTGAPEKLAGYKIKGKFDNLAMLQVGQMPGFSGLSVAIDGDDQSGHLNINTRNLALEAPGVMREPLSFNTLTGQARWQHEQGELAIKMDNVALANDDLTGNLYGSYKTRAGTRGIADITLALTRGDLKRAARYTPFFALGKKDNDWLNEAMVSGHTEDFRLHIKGNLSDFPLNGKTDTTLEINAHTQDAIFEFARDWPRIENISGEFLVRNNRMEVNAPSATMLGARLNNVTVVQQDMTKPDIPLQVKGEAEGSNKVFLQFIQQSPVRGYINGFTDDMNASGNGRVELLAHIPLQPGVPAKVAGKFFVQGSDIDMGPGMPWMRNTRGELSFSESGVLANNITTEILGGPARMNVQTAEGAVKATAQGRANLEVLRKTENSPLLNFLHGSTAWEANISMVKKAPQLVLTSTLQGLSSTLPAPLTKSAGESWPLRIDKKNISDTQDVINAQLGKLAKARLFRSEENGVNIIKRGVISFGAQELPSDKQIADYRTGVWLTGNLPALSLQGWDGLAAGSGPGMPIAGANLHIDRLSLFGMNIDDLKLNAAKRGDGLAAQLASAPLNGEVIWQPQGYEGNSKLSAHLRNLYLIADATAATELKGRPDDAKLKAEPAKPRDLPAMDISIEDLLYKGKQIGRFELVGMPEGRDWRLRRLHITNPDGTVSGDGLWRSTQTQINLLLEISNAGKILARSGYPNTVKNGNGKLSASLSWAGQPDDFNYATLDGTLKLDTGQGQFLKMDPGIGKLLGILSLQALPKRITLDFTDVFSSGFEFDNINGNATIRRGIMQTQDLHLDGSAAKVTMQGIVNLNDETQNMHVVVLPTLGSSVSMLSAFAAGPVVGLGTLIVSKVLGNPLDKLISFEYNVSGTWGNPNVIKVGQTPVTVQPAPKAPATKP